MRAAHPDASDGLPLPHIETCRTGSDSLIETDRDHERLRPVTSDGGPNLEEQLRPPTKGTDQGLRRVRQAAASATVMSMTRNMVSASVPQGISHSFKSKVGRTTETVTRGRSSRKRDVLRSSLQKEESRYEVARRSTSATQQRTNGVGRSRNCRWLRGILSGWLRRAPTWWDELIPGWARLNIFAHGDLEDLELTYRSTTGRGSIGPAGETEEAWRTTLAALAGVLIEFVDGDPKMLPHLQRGVLIPLEFELMAADALTAFELLRCTRAALRSSIA